MIKNLILTALAVFGLTAGAMAQTHQSLSFIGAGGSGFVGGANGLLQMQATSTNTYGSTALIYAKGSYVTNVLINVTNAANGLVIQQYQSVFTPIFVTNAAGISDVTLWANRDGTAPLANISVDYFGSAATATNLITLNFAAKPINGGNVATGASSLFSFSFNGNGTNDVVITTNLPQTVLQGNYGFRLISAVSTNGAVQSNVGSLNCWLNGYKPAGAE